MSKGRHVFCYIEMLHVETNVGHGKIYPKSLVVQKLSVFVVCRLCGHFFSFRQIKYVCIHEVICDQMHKMETLSMF